MSAPLTCLKAYDMRGRIPDQLNEDVLYRIGRAYAEFLKLKTVVVATMPGRTARYSPPRCARR